MCFASPGNPVINHHIIMSCAHRVNEAKLVVSGLRPIYGEAEFALNILQVNVTIFIPVVIRKDGIDTK